MLLFIQEIAMQVDDKFISYLEDLSCLVFSKKKKNSLIGDLQEILVSIAKIHELNTDGVSECCSPLDNVNIFREDEVYPSCNREMILKNAPVKNDEMFIAPKTVE
jgi:aspartyl-tRNA(Asn)/glutamyl-tRNA(Gln) amidotransferase subunit C